MEWYFILLIAIGALLLIVLLTSLACYILTFFNKKHHRNEYLELPNLPQYNYYKEQIFNNIKEVESYPYEDVSIISYDKTKLTGKLYLNPNTSYIEIMFHGYRGSGKRDLSTGIKRAFACNHSALIVDQRGHGGSSSRTICFGIRESKDALKWIDFVNDKLGVNTKIIICGISMGASTVINAGANKLPSNVIGILADCGYDNTKDIIQKFVKDMKLPPKIFYPFIKLGAKLFANLNVEEIQPIDSVKNITLPILFVHGTGDSIVPSYMSENLYDLCSSSNKRLLLIEEAEHGLAYLKEPERYIEEVISFFNK